MEELTPENSHLAKVHPAEIPQSPFLPNTNIQFAVDSTSLGLMKTCPRLYQYVMLDGLTSKEENIHLRFGTEFHQAMQDYDISLAEGIPHDDAVHDVVRELVHRTFGWDVDTESRAGKYKNRDSLIRTVVNYLDHFRNDPATTHILHNGKAAVELSFRFELGYGPSPDQPYILCGHLDRVVEFNGDLFVMDYKTTTTTPGDYFFNQFEPSNQMTLYSLGAKVILSSPVKGVIINAVQLMIDSNRFVRGFTMRTEEQLVEWQNDLAWLLQIFQAYSEQNYWPMNDTACDKFGGCKFRGVCSKSPGQARDIYLKDFVKQPVEERWNPLRSR